MQDLDRNNEYNTRAQIIGRSMTEQKAAQDNGFFLKNSGGGYPGQAGIANAIPSPLSGGQGGQGLNLTLSVITPPASSTMPGAISPAMPILSGGGVSGPAKETAKKADTPQIGRAHV